MDNNKKTILVTGGAGFVGHHVCEGIFKATNWDIVVLDSLNYAGNLNRISDIFSDILISNSKRLKIVWHDLKAPISETTHKLIGKLDYCIHMAAESHVDRSLVDSIPFVMSNVLGTANLLEYLKKSQLECKTLIFSTDEVFGSTEPGVAFKEEDRFKPSNPYSASKAGAEMIAYSFAHSFYMPISFIRSTNIFGERQHPEKFIPKTIRAILNNEKVVLHGKGKENSCSRCWIHARNVGDALLFLLKKSRTKEAYHIAGEEKGVLEIADWICEVIKGRKLKEEEIQWIDCETARPGYDKRYLLSGEKLEKMGWKPPIDLEKSLKKTVKWTLENPQWLHL